ncbi:hypothetical protein [Filobacillus milosensis]|nr:hypothetical protein [Filobacillus milosensis]
MDKKFKQDSLYFLHDGVGVVTNEDKKSFVKEFVAAIAEHRHWNRELV